MFCIKCHNPDTKVINSRPHKKRASIWRRRACPQCGTVFTTTETVSVEGALSITDNRGEITSFSIGRLLMSIAPLLSEHSSAPDDAYWLAMTSYEKALATGANTLSAVELARLTFGVVERFDSTAALKYALDHKLTKLPSSRAKRPKL